MEWNEKNTKELTDYLDAQMDRLEYLESVRDLDQMKVVMRGNWALRFHPRYIHLMKKAYHWVLKNFIKELDPDWKEES